MSAGRIDDDAMFTRVDGPLAVVRCCTRCRFHVTTRKLAGLRPSSIGRGHGFVVGNQARGELIQHFKTAHPEDYAALRARARG